MSDFFIITGVIVFVLWLLLAFFGEDVLKYLYKYEEEDNSKSLEDYLKKRYEKFKQDQKKRALDNPFAKGNDYNMDETRIVGIRKPIGKWTRLVTMRNLEYLSNFRQMIGGKLSTKMGFWQLKVRGQSFGEGKSKGRGR